MDYGGREVREVRALLRAGGSKRAALVAADVQIDVQLQSADVACSSGTVSNVVLHFSFVSSEFC